MREALKCHLRVAEFQTLRTHLVAWAQAGGTSRRAGTGNVDPIWLPDAIVSLRMANRSCFEHIEGA